MNSFAIERQLHLESGEGQISLPWHPLDPLSEAAAPRAVIVTVRRSFPVRRPLSEDARAVSVSIQVRCVAEVTLNDDLTPARFDTTVTQEPGEPRLTDAQLSELLAAWPEEAQTLMAEHGRPAQLLELIRENVDVWLTGSARALVKARRALVEAEVRYRRDLLLHAVAHTDEDPVRRAAARLVDDWTGTSDALLEAAREDATP